MCGIAGFVGNYDPKLLQQMSGLIAHRGPDDHGELLLSFKDYNIGFAHSRLSIIDLSKLGHQPMSVTCPNCRCSSQDINEAIWLTYNGEIYNYKELRDDLIRRGHVFASNTDSEVILHLYAEYGPSMLGKLNGIFAFALYDGRSIAPNRDGMRQGDVLIARDGVGVKPVYFAQTNQGFIFASELKALLASAAVAKDLDLAAINYYLSFLWCPGSQTPLKSIKKLEPGQCLVIRDKQVQKSFFYYDLPYGQKKLDKNDSIYEELRSKLKTAIERQMVSDVPIGAFLSGGLDSSTVVAMMKQLKPDQKLQCYTVDFGHSNKIEGNPDDLPYAKQVAKYLNVDLSIIKLDSNMIFDLEKMIYFMDEPQADPAPLNVYRICQAARQDGIKVLMSGAGGDDIFSGYRRHAALRSEKYLNLLPFKKLLASMALKAQNGDYSFLDMTNPFMRRIAKLFSYIDQSIDNKIVNYFNWNTKDTRMQLYSSEFIKELEENHIPSPLISTLLRLSQEEDSLNKLLYLEGKHFLPDHNLNYTDKMSMAVGVEVRVPLLDLELINFATRIPPSMKQKGNVGKAVLKKAMEPYLPKNIIYRPKTGFGAPLRHWLKNELKPLVYDLLSSSSINSRGLFNARNVARLVELDQKGKVDASYTIFSLLCIEIWCRLFIDGKKPL